MSLQYYIAQSNNINDKYFKMKGLDNRTTNRSKPKVLVCLFFFNEVQKIIMAGTNQRTICSMLCGALGSCKSFNVTYLEIVRLEAYRKR